MNTSESFADPSVHPATADIATDEITGTCDPGGKPDSTAKAPDGSVVAAAIRDRGLLAVANEEELVEDGGVGTHAMIHRRQDAPAAYPTLASEGAGAPHPSHRHHPRRAAVAETGPQRLRSGR